MANTTFVIDAKGAVGGDVATATAQRLMVWARHDKRVRVSHTGDGKLMFIVPDELAAAAAAGGYGPAVATSKTNTVTITPGAGAAVSMAYTNVSGIDPNDNTTVKDPGPVLTVASVAGEAGTLKLTWTYNQRQTWFLLRSRTAAVTGPPAVPAGPWSRAVAIPGYMRQHYLRGLKTGTAYEFQLQAKVTDGMYVPILSELDGIKTGTPA